jgi:predicted hydrocarbon binding protein
MDPSEHDKILEILPDLWAEIGFGRLSLKSGSEEDFTLDLYESIEANAIGEVGQASCDFTRGYLAGMVSYLSGKKYHCKEESCVSRGDKHCKFLLSQKGEAREM